MATTEHYKNGTGNQATTFDFTFPYLKKADVVVKVYESGAWATKTETTHYTFPTVTSIQFVSGQVPASGSNNIHIYRSTSSETMAATFYAGSAIRSADLNDNFTQNLYVTQESENRALNVDAKLDKTGGTMTGLIAFHTGQSLTGNVTGNLTGNVTGNVTGNTSGSSGSTTGNAATATALQNARTIGGVSFDGTGNINLAGVNATGNQDTSGSAATLTTARTIGGVSFDGSANINLPGVNTGGNQDTSGKATTAGTADEAAKLSATKTIGMTGDVVWTSSAFDGSSNVTGTAAIQNSSVEFSHLDPAGVLLGSETWSDSETLIPTAKAVDSRIDDLVEEFGAFIPIANETSFPNANPDPDDNTGTLISIKALASNQTSNGSGVITIANGNVANSATVTINGLANSTTYIAGNGMLVETTSTLHTYTFHRELASAANITTVANSIDDINIVAGDITYAEDLGLVTESLTTSSGNDITTVADNINAINSFSDIYRVASSAPSSSLDEGDLWYDSTANILKYYNSSAWVSLTTGITSLLEDQTPELYAALDCNDKNLTEVGTVSGTNLQIDFGTL